MGGMAEHPAAQVHGPIQEIAEGVHWVRGSVRMGPGVTISRLMVIVKSGEELSLISAVRLSDEGEAELAKLGKVRNVLKIGAFHGMDDAYSVERFQADYWALPGARLPAGISKSKELKQGELPIPDADLFVFESAVKPEGALLVKRAGGVLVTCDSVQNWPDTEGCSLIAKGITRAMGFTSRRAQIGPPWRKGMTPQGGSLKGDFERLASLDFKHLIGAHGGPLRDTAKSDLKATVAATFG